MNGNLKVRRNTHDYHLYNGMNTKGSLVNKHGIIFSQLIDKLSFAILNGNFERDKFEEFTHYNQKGTSVIDYILILLYLCDNILHFENICR